MAGFGTLEPDIEAAARRVHHVARDPVAAAALAVGEIVAAHRFGVAREAARQIAGLADHGASRGSGGGAGASAQQRMTLKERGEDWRASVLGGRHEEPQAP